VHTKEQNLSVAKQWCETYGDVWVWLAFAPLWRLLVAFVVGKRTQEHANLLLERVSAMTDAHIPSSRQVGMHSLPADAPFGIDHAGIRTSQQLDADVILLPHVRRS
jgi:hypothetical protein